MSAAIIDPESYEQGEGIQVIGPPVDLSRLDVRRGEAAEQFVRMRSGAIIAGSNFSFRPNFRPESPYYFYTDE